MDIKEASTVKDLREITFSDLFYEIFYSGDGAEKAGELAQRIEPGYSLEYELDAEKLTADLRACLKEVEERRDRITAGEKLLADLRRGKTYQGVTDGLRLGYVLFYMDKFNPNKLCSDDLPLEARIDAMDKWHDKVQNDTKGAEESVDVSAVVDYYLNAEPDERVKWLNWICFHELEKSGRFICKYDLIRKRVIDEIRSRLHGTEETPLKKYLVALVTLPKLTDDQDIILFFGEYFNKAFEDINAYVGLLYAYEYFEYAGMI